MNKRTYKIGALRVRKYHTGLRLFWRYGTYLGRSAVTNSGSFIVARAWVQPMKFRTKRRIDAIRWLLRGARHERNLPG